MVMMDIERLRQVGEDIQHLRDEVAETVSDAQIRRVSVHLRKLLVDDELIWARNCLRLLPKKLEIQATRIDSGEPAQGDTIFAGTARSGGMTVFSTSIRVGQSDLPKLKIFGNFNFTWSEYKNSSLIIHNGERISRQQLVQYMANKKGGAHFDRRRGNKSDRPYEVLDHLEHYFISDRSAIYHQFLSIGQDIVRSQHVKELEEAIKVTISSAP